MERVKQFVSYEFCLVPEVLQTCGQCIYRYELIAIIVSFIGVHTVFVDGVFIAADVYRREKFW